jgi:hypothetical protein
MANNPLEDLLLNVKSTFDSSGLESAIKETIRLNDLNKDISKSLTIKQPNVNPIEELVTTGLNEKGLSSKLEKITDLSSMGLDAPKLDVMDFRVDDIIADASRSLKDTNFKIETPELKEFNTEKYISSLKDMDSVNKILSDATKKITPLKKGFTSIGDVLSGLNKKISNAGKGMSGVINYSFLGIMFAGMALQRTFQGIATQSLSTYKDISQGSTSASQALNMLEGSFTLVRYSVGEAIGMFIEAHPKILQIIEAVSEWISDNNNLVASLVIGGLILGIVLGIVGQLVIGMQSLFGVIGDVGSSLIKALGLFGDFLGLSGLSAVLVPLLIIIAVAALLYAAWTTNLGNLRDYIMTFAGNVIDSFLGLISGVIKVLSGIWKIISGIFSGDFDKVMSGVKEVFVGTLQVMGNILLNFFSSIINLAILLINILKDLFFSLVNMVIGLFEEMTNVIVAGLNILLIPINKGLKAIGKEPIKIPNVDFSDARDSINKFKESITIPSLDTTGMSKSMNTFFDSLSQDTPKTLTLDSITASVTNTPESSLISQLTSLMGITKQKTDNLDIAKEEVAIEQTKTSELEKQIELLNKIKNLKQDEALNSTTIDLLKSYGS